MHLGRVRDVLANGETRVLADRLWPRGMKKADPRIGRWMPEVAPSTELRRWYGHEDSRREEFAARYETELEQLEDSDGMRDLRELAQEPGFTLVTDTKVLAASHLPVLAAYLGQEAIPVVQSSQPVAAIERWIAFGGSWAVRRESSAGVEVALLRCDGGEQVDSLSSDEPAFREWVEMHRD